MNKNINVLALAYLGDSIYEVYVRKYLISKHIEKVNELQKEATKFVSAKGQASILKDMMDNNFLTDEETGVVIRARNHKSHAAPKNTDIVTYKYATGLEALIGYLYLDNRLSRIEEIINYILK
jgi:ribonuclease-3 family protein